MAKVASRKTGVSTTISRSPHLTPIELYHKQTGLLLPNYNTVAKEAAEIDLHGLNAGLIVINH